MNINFKCGQLITGVDRTYRRTIYRFIGIGASPAGYDLPRAGEMAAILEAVSFEGQSCTGWSVMYRYEKIGSLHQDFRLASQEEIDAG